MKVLTVREPWLWAIIEGGKNTENRGLGALTWKPQTIGLHGAQRYSWRGHSDPRVLDAWQRVTNTPMVKPERCGRYLCHDTFEMGIIVATVDLVDVHPDTGCCRPWGESHYSGDTKTVEAVAHLVLENVQRLDCVIPARGRLGLWRCDELDEADVA